MGSSALKVALASLVGAGVIAVIVGGGLAWRLSDGPLDITGLTRRVAPLVAPGITADRVTLALQREGGRHVLRLDVSNGVRASEDGAPVQSVRSATVSLALAPLLIGLVEPETVTLDGLQLHLRELQRSSQASASSAETPRRQEIRRLLQSLRQVTVTDASVALIAGPDGQDAQVTGGAATLARAPDGTLSGQAGATADIGGLTARMEAIGTFGDQGGQLHVTVSPLSPAAVANAVPALASIGALDAQIALRADASFSPVLDLRRAVLHAESGPGVVALPANGGGTSGAHFASMSLDAEGTANALTLQALRLVLAPPSGAPVTTVVLSGAGSRQAGHVKADVSIDLDHAAFADLAALWPDKVGGGARSWLTENLTAGTAHDGHFNLVIEGKENGSDIELTGMTGTMAADDVTVWWLRPVPPILHAHGMLVWQSPDAAVVNVADGRQAGVAVSNATIRFTGFTAKHQTGLIDTDLNGPLPDVLTVLKNPRLQLLSKHPITMDKPAGAVSAHLSVQVPLESTVTIDQVPIHANGQVTSLHLGGVALGRDIDQGQLGFDVTNDGLTFNGPLRFDHIPSQLALQMDFRSGPPSQVLQHVVLSAKLAPADAQAAGLQAIGLQAGTVPATVDYSERRDATATVQLYADLKDAAFETQFGWSKASGPAGFAQGRALLDHGRIVGLDGLHAEAPGLSIVARSDMVRGRPAIVHIERGDIGRSSATGTIALPQHDGDAYRVVLSGPRLDLEGRLRARDRPASPEHEPGPSPSQTGTPYDVDLHFDRVILGPNLGLSAISLNAVGTGSRLTSARLLSGPPERFRVDLATAGLERKLTATAANLGALLQSADLATELVGGELELAGTFDDRQRESPFAGTLDLRNFKVRGAPIAAKLLQAVTLYGVVDALKGPGLAFDRMVTDFRLQGPALDLADARAFSSSLGLTASGHFDFGRKTIDLRGTIVPAYFFNSLLGRLPVLGRIFSPEKGSGVFAANYGLTGQLTEPSVSINPLSALTPGFTRKFFDLFD